VDLSPVIGALIELVSGSRGSTGQLERTSQLSSSSAEYGNPGGYLPG